MIDSSDYHWSDSSTTNAHRFLLPKVASILRDHAGCNEAGLAAAGSEKRIFDLGCGNGSVPNFLSTLGYEVVGVDPSEEGILQARKSYPTLRLETGSAYEDLRQRFGTFPVVISLEVIEHLYDPKRYARTLYDLLSPGGAAIVSTPFHGYWKNLAIAIAGGFDTHFTALWDNGHIKFWSMRTLRVLLEEAGFVDLKFFRVGRIAPLARSMIVVARKGA
jgi:2-polyprenyl-6-hydroxyphenyl methylase/3-demethylubiquinone-9 3-methyltransferase